MKGELINIENPDIIAEFLAKCELIDDKPTLLPLNPTKWLMAMRQCVGMTVRLILVRDRKKRTSPQNRMLWGLVYEDIFQGLLEKAREYGMGHPFKSKNEMHWWFKRENLTSKRVFPWGEEFDTVGSTTMLDTKQFSDYVELLCAWAAQRGIYVRQAGERVTVA